MDLGDAMFKMTEQIYNLKSKNEELKSLLDFEVQKREVLERILEEIREICKCSKGSSCEECPHCGDCEELCVNDDNLQNIIINKINEVLRGGE